MAWNGELRLDRDFYNGFRFSFDLKQFIVLFVRFSGLLSVYEFYEFLFVYFFIVGFEGC